MTEKKMINDIVIELASKHCLSKKKAKQLTTDMFFILATLIKQNDEVLISNFGKFKTLPVIREKVILNKEKYNVVVTKTVSFSPARNFNKYFRGVKNE